MKVQLKTVTNAQLTAGTEIEIAVKLTDENGIDRIPSEILFVNGTGAGVGVVYLDSDAEKTIKTDNPTMFDFLPLDTGRTNGVLPTSIEYIIVKKLSGTVTEDLTFYLMNYVRRNDDN